MKMIKELELLNGEGSGFNIRFYDTKEVEISYFEKFHCVDYVFVSEGTWNTFFNEYSSWNRTKI